MFNLSGLNFNINTEALKKAREASGTTVAPVTQQINYTPPENIVDVMASSLDEPYDFGINSDLFSDSLRNFDSLPTVDPVVSNDPWASVNAIGTNIEQGLANDPQGREILKNLAIANAGNFDFTPKEAATVAELGDKYGLHEKYAEQLVPLAQNLADVSNLKTQEWQGARSANYNPDAVASDIEDAFNRIAAGEVKTIDDVKYANEGFGVTLTEQDRARQQELADQTIKASQQLEGAALQLKQVQKAAGDSAKVGQVMELAGNIASGGMLGVMEGLTTGIYEGDVKKAVGSAALGYANLQLKEAAELTKAAEAAMVGPNANWATTAQLGQKAKEAKQAASAAQAVTSVISGNYGTAVVQGMLSQGVDPIEEFGNSLNITDGLGGLSASDTAKLGVSSAVQLADGVPLDKVLENAAITYVRNSEGTLETPEFLKEFDKEVLQPAKKEVEKSLGTIYEDVIKPIDKEVLQPVKETIVDVAKPVYEDVIKPAGTLVTDAAQYVDDQYIDPFVSTVKETLDPIQEVGREIDKEILQPTYEVAKDVGKAIDDTIIDPIDQVIRDIEAPDVNVDLPDVNIDLPKIDWGGLFKGLLGVGGLMAAASQGGTRATSVEAPEDITVRPMETFKFNPYKSKIAQMKLGDY